MNILEIERMSMIDRLQAMETLWDSFKEEKSEIDSPGMASGHPRKKKDQKR